MINKTDDIRALERLMYVGSDEERRAVYFGAATAYVKMKLYENGLEYGNDVKWLSDIKDVVFKLNELAIIDVSVVTRIFKNVFEAQFRNRNPKHPLVLDIDKGILGLLDITEHISKVDIENIENHIESFGDAYRYFISFYNDYIKTEE